MSGYRNTAKYVCKVYISVFCTQDVFLKDGHRLNKCTYPPPVTMARKGMRNVLLALLEEERDFWVHKPLQVLCCLRAEEWEGTNLSELETLHI